MRGSINCSFRALGGLQNVNGPQKRVFREKLTLDTQGARKEVHEAPHGSILPNVHFGNFCD